MSPEPYTRFGRYEVRSKLGEGGMGEVYRAHDPKLGRDVAVKVLPAAYSADAQRLQRFEQEARAAGALNHPNVLAIHDVETHDGAPFVVSELLEGQTLREQLRREGTVLSLAGQEADGGGRERRRLDVRSGRSQTAVRAAPPDGRAARTQKLLLRLSRRQALPRQLGRRAENFVADDGGSELDF